jgi:transcriptional regulator with XRE-family HTH domain
VTDPSGPLGREFKLNPIKEPDSPAGQLAQALRELAGTTKAKSLSDFADLIKYSRQRISELLSGKPHLVAPEEVIKVICNFCNADESTLARLREMRAQAIDSRAPGRSPADSPPTDPPTEPSPTDPPPPDFTPVHPSVPSGPARWKWLLVVASVVVLLVAAGVVVWQWWPNGCGAFSGIRLNDEQDRECIGITDGSYPFNDPVSARNNDDKRTIEEINEVQKKIEAENTAVAQTNRYVKIVLLAPLTVSQARPSATSLKQILYSLQGSYTGLMRANNSIDFGDPSAEKLQLLLANEGSQQEAGTDFMDSIVKMSQPDHPVVTVIGLGVSVPNTKTAVEYLAQRKIPMVSAVASADDLTNLPLLWSVEPSNRDFVRALGSFLDRQTTLKSGLIVYDQNADLFTRSLAKDYRDQLGKPDQLGKIYDTFPDQPFRGSTVESPTAPNVFGPVVTNLCNAANNPHNPLDMVFYAGRGVDFSPFVEALSGAARTCRNQPLTVLTASTGFTLSPADLSSLKSANVTIVFATTSDPVTWGKNTEIGAPPGYAAFLATYHASGFLDDTDLVDGYAIAYYDALVTAARAIRLAAQESSAAPPSPQDVASIGFGHLSLSYAVPAAAGTLTFPPDGGRVIDPSIPIEQMIK